MHGRRLRFARRLIHDRLHEGSRKLAEKQFNRCISVHDGHGLAGRYQQNLIGRFPKPPHDMIQSAAGIQNHPIGVPAKLIQLP